MPCAANGKAAPLGSLFLFERFLKRGGGVIFFAENLHMSIKSSTFALEIGKTY